jgi:hypothetical protein
MLKFISNMNLKKKIFSGIIGLALIGSVSAATIVNNINSGNTSSDISSNVSSSVPSSQIDNTSSDIAAIQSVVNQGVSKIQQVTSDAVSKVQATQSKITSSTVSEVQKVSSDTSSQQLTFTFVPITMQVDKMDLGFPDSPRIQGNVLDILFGGHFNDVTLMSKKSDIPFPGITIKDSSGNKINYSVDSYQILIPMSSIQKLSKLFITYDFINRDANWQQAYNDLQAGKMTQADYDTKYPANPQTIEMDIS